jgi:hypothetical protein
MEPIITEPVCPTETQQSSRITRQPVIRTMEFAKHLEETMEVGNAEVHADVLAALDLGRQDLGISITTDYAGLLIPNPQCEHPR